MVALDHLADALCRECLSAFPGRRLLGAWLYGSHAAGRSRPDSDIDVAVLLDEPLDAVVLNLQRACEQAIDAACREVSRLGLGVPADSADALSLLERESLLSPPLAERMRRMVGFRNVAVHEYRRLDPAIVQTVVEHRLGDFEALCRELAAAR